MLFTILQQGEQDDPFYTVQVNGKDYSHHHYLVNAAEAVEKLKQVVQPAHSGKMVRWLAKEDDSD